MTVENQAVEVEAVEVAKRKRTVKPKVTKTAIQIQEELRALEGEVTDLETAVQQIDPTNILHSLATKVFEDKKAELNKALETIYTI